MSPAATTDATEELVKELYRLGSVRRELSRHALAELGSQGFTALGVIEVHGPLRVSEVADRLLVDLSVASRQVAALAAAGYVGREPDPDDRRAFLVSTTEAGRRVLDESHRRMVDGIGVAIHDWPVDDIVALSTALARLREDFAAASTQPTPDRGAA
jgi:DNA-binding MarR family transcriptional regulator